MIKDYNNEVEVKVSYSGIALISNNISQSIFSRNYDCYSQCYSS